jgi:hypothetical protein
VTTTKYPESQRLTSLFENPTKSGGSYFSGKLGGDKPINIMPGQRITLVKSSKTTKDGAPIWSLLLDPMGAADGNRVYENRGDQDLHRDRQPAPDRRHFDRDPDDAIPF